MVKKQEFPVWVWIIIALLILILLNQKGIINIFGNDVEEQNYAIGETEVSEYSNCLDLCLANGFNKGYSANNVNDCLVGNTFLTYGYTGELPLLSCCCFTHTESGGTDEGTGDGAETEEGGEEDLSGYTCGNPDHTYCYGTCPDDYPECLEVWTGLYTWACMCTNEDEEVHPAWKPDGEKYYEHDETPVIDYVCCVQQVAYDDGDSPVSCYEYSCPTGWSPVYSVVQDSGECISQCTTPSCGGRKRHVATCTGIPYYWCGSTYVKSGTTYYPCSYTGGGGTYCKMDTSYTCTFTAPN